MNVLAIDTSTIVATVALVDEEKVLSEMTNYSNKKNHSERLMLLVDEVLKSSGVALKDVDLFSCGIGPGSFTGLRIAIATVKGLAQSLGKPVLGVSTLKALAYNVPYAGGLVCPIIDAQRDQVYTCFYRWTDEGLEELGQETVYTVDELVEVIDKNHEQVTLLGDGLKKISSEIIEERKGKIKCAPVSCRMPKASSTAALSLDLAQKGTTMSYSDLEPNYMRKSQAEIQLEGKKQQTP